MYFIIGFGNGRVTPRILFVGTNAKFDVLNKDDIVDSDDEIYNVFTDKDLFHTVTIYQIDEDEWRDFMGKKGSGFYLALVRTLTEEKTVNVDRILKSMKFDDEEEDDEEEEDEEDEEEKDEDDEEEDEDDEEEDEDDEEEDEDDEEEDEEEKDEDDEE